jgi:phosphohistidine phosphatase
MATGSDRLFWLLRHAKTLTPPPKGGGDHERRLAPRGRRDATALGKALGDKGDVLGLERKSLPGLVLCSTATRTTQTAEMAFAAMSSPPPIHFERALYGASTDEVVAQVRMVDDDIRSVMVVGHNPTAHELSVTVTDPNDRKGRADLEARGFPTCSLAVYRVPAATWSEFAEGTCTLVKLFTPPF